MIRVAWGIAALVGLGLAAGLAFEHLQVRNLQKRVTTLEATSSQRAEAATQDEAAREARRQAFEQALEERIAAVLQDVASRKREAAADRPDRPDRPGGSDVIAAGIRAWAEREGLDAAATDALVQELDRRAQAAKALRADLRDGLLTPAEAREEADAGKAESDAALLRLLGEDRFADFDRDVLARLQGQGAP